MSQGCPHQCQPEPTAIPTQLVRQLVAEHREGGAEAAGEAVGEGSAWGSRAGGGQSGRKLSPGLHSLRGLPLPGSPLLAPQEPGALTRLCPRRHTYGQPIGEVVQTVSQEDHPRDAGVTAALVPMTVAVVPGRAWGWWGVAVRLPAALSPSLCRRKDKVSVSGCR